MATTLAGALVRLSWAKDFDFMNKILHLFDKDYVSNYFTKELLPQYPEASGFEINNIIPYKKMVWTTTYHVVIGYELKLTLTSGEAKEILVICTAHSNEDRENVYQAMSYLWGKEFNQDGIEIPKPLFYSDYFQASFYQGVVGPNLLNYIKKGDREQIDETIPLAAKMFARLHQLSVGQEANFSEPNSRIRTVIPGVTSILEEMSKRYQGKYDQTFAKVLSYMVETEEKTLSAPDFKLRLIHGDAHAENIIHPGKDKIALIDFTDFCLADPARDIGTFKQQIEYKISFKMKDEEYAQAKIDQFMEAYFRYNNTLVNDDDFKQRVRLYYNWTRLRTAVFLFLKQDGNPSQAELFLNLAKEGLQL